MSMLVFTFGFFGCSDPPVLNGTVLDIWNKPIEGATVYINGIEEPQVSQSNGSFSFVLEDFGEQTIRLRTEAKDYISDVETTVFSKESEEVEPLAFHLYPKPTDKGFFGIGDSKYLPLEEQKVYTEGTKLEVFNGINSVGSVSLSKSKNPFVFYSKLIKEEIRQLDLTLYQLEFKENEEVKGILGETSIEIDLWMAKPDLAYDITLRPLGEDYMFLLEFEESLPSGVYAFHSGTSLIKPDPRNKDIRPEELKVAYPFRIK